MPPASGSARWSAATSMQTGRYRASAGSWGESSPSTGLGRATGLSPQDDGTLHIPYPKHLVEDSPEVDADDDLAGEALECVRRHYATLRDLPHARDAPGNGARSAVQIGRGRAPANGEPGPVTGVR